MEKGDVAHLRIPAVWEKVTVTANLMGENMMVTLDVALDWFVAATTAGSLVFTITRRMIAVIILQEDTTTKLVEDMTRTGLNGAALVPVTMERRQDPEAVMDPPAPGPSKLKIEIATPLINMDMVLMDMEMDTVLEVDTALEEDTVLEEDTAREEETVMDLDPDMDMEEVV